MDSIQQFQDTIDVLTNKLGLMDQVIVEASRILIDNNNTLKSIRELILHKHVFDLQSSHPNPLNKFGKKCFSQNYEDGITLEIIRRLGLSNGSYAEFGVGNGLENNTLILAALGWKGFWVGAEDLLFDYSKATKFYFFKGWVNLDNIIQYYLSGINALNDNKVDVLSLDLDGNDYYFVETLLEYGITPKLFIAEYNPRFPPPIKFKITYDANFKQENDCFGASLSSFVELFSRFDYRLVCCNSDCGSNIFFIHDKFSNLFDDVPSDINSLYMGPRYHTYTQPVYPQLSRKIIESIINR